MCERERRGELIKSSHAYLGTLQLACCWIANDDSLANMICHLFSSAAPVVATGPSIGTSPHETKLSCILEKWQVRQQSVLSLGNFSQHWLMMYWP